MDTPKVPKNKNMAICYINNLRCFFHKLMLIQVSHLKFPVWTLVGALRLQRQKNGYLKKSYLFNWHHGTVCLYKSILKIKHELHINLIWIHIFVYFYVCVPVCWLGRKTCSSAKSQCVLGRNYESYRHGSTILQPRIAWQLRLVVYSSKAVC